MTDRLLQRRGAGVLLPLFSLPERYGIGTMGAAAYRFVDDLSSAGSDTGSCCPCARQGREIHRTKAPAALQAMRCILTRSCW